MKMRLTKLRLICGAAIINAGSLLHAQTDAPRSTPAPNAVAKEGESLITLGEFVVTSTVETGYRATNSISATGVGAPIGDTPTMINVVTRDLILDTRADRIIDALRLVPSAIIKEGNESSARLRGFTAAILRNGVFRRQNLNTWNLDNVEIIQGPVSIFYSNISPGGVINYNTIKPVFDKTSADLSVTTGNWDYLRSEFGVNVGNEKLALRIDAGELSGGSYRNQKEGEKFLSLSESWKISPNQMLTVEGTVESQNLQNNNSGYKIFYTNSRYWKNPSVPAGQSLATFMQNNYPTLPRYDMFAPIGPSSDPYLRLTPFLKSYFSALDRTLDATYVVKLTDSLVFNVVTNYTWENAEGTNPVTTDPLSDGTFTGWREERFVNVRDSYNLNSRFTYRFNLGNTTHTLLLGNDNQWVVQRFPEVSSLGANADPAHPFLVSSNNMRSNVFNFNPLTDPQLDGQALLTGVQPFNSLRDRVDWFSGTYLSEQVTLLNKSLFINLGERYTKYTTKVWWPGRSDLQQYKVPDANLAKMTPQFGALYKIANGPVSIYYTHSQSIVPQGQGATDASGQNILPQNVTGWDLGTKFDLLSDRLTGAIAYYEITLSHVALSDNVQNAAHGLPNGATFGYYLYGNTQKARGLQVDTSYNITKNFQILFGGNQFFQDEFIGPNPTNPSVVGTNIGLPTTSAYTWLRYGFTSGALKGLYVAGGPRYDSKEIAKGGDANYIGFYIPSYIVFDALVGYDFKVYGHVVKAALNIKDLTNKIYRDSGNDGNSSWATPRSIQLTLTAKL